MNVKLIRAFIASPGGLDTERIAAHSAAEEVNRSVAKPLGGRLELIGWEETLSGNGRGQALINADMETCELFIGLIWDRWGSHPALTGPYTSGFEEEFEISRERHLRTGSPKMALFFKAAGTAQHRDPGSDYKKVITFQERLKSEKNFLYSNFNEVEQFTSKVREFLSAHVIRILREGEESTDSGPTSASEKTPSRVGDTLPEDVGNSGARVLARFSAALKSENGPSAADVARLRLVAATSEKTGNDSQVIGVHDANLVYVDRSEFTLSFAERRGLVDAGLLHFNSQNTPIWTWIASFSRERPDILLALTAFRRRWATHKRPQDFTTSRAFS
jgi:hypothetical protein